MTKSYVEIFNLAFEAYSNAKERDGYPNGFLTFFRHSLKKNDHLNNLENNLIQQDNDEKSMALLREYFKSERTTFNNHSFSLYLLDMLEEYRPLDENWQECYPNDKKIVFYTGRLYRGTLQGSRDAFTNGIVCEESHAIEDYASDTPCGIGVSTSKEEKIASGYANKIYRHHSQVKAVELSGYTYHINYRDTGGIDLEATHRQRGNGIVLNVTRVKDKKEVNIIGKISPEDIEGCYCHKTKRFIPNPHYIKNKSNPTEKTFVKKRQEFFSPFLNHKAEITGQNSSMDAF
ncbi:hypothetical protein L3V82_10510 [Thiotrichales bacterium 19S3-7]|nr:hypothetical protein [Thiotrichales bacterium 19S3-7]MCF6802588.1 hypothetical protein [Thiotrichales bacterium 19S3-11]